MAEIHDQFDTILILDFGSQVLIRLTDQCVQAKIPSAVQSSDNKEMQGA